MVSRLRVPVVALVVATMVVLAGLAFGRIYAGDLLTKLLVGAALGAVAISLALYRLPAYTVAPTSVLALLGYSLYAVKVSAATLPVFAGA